MAEQTPKPDIKETTKNVQIIVTGEVKATVNKPGFEIVKKEA